MKSESDSSEQAPPRETAPSEVERAASLSPRIQVINTCAVALTAALAITAVVVLMRLLDARNQSEAMHRRYEECSAAATDLMSASDYLTAQSRMYVVTGGLEYLEGYLDELQTVRRRDHAVSTLEREGGDSHATAMLSAALDKSNELAELELYAMRLTVDATGLAPMPDTLSGIEVSPGDAALPAEEKRALAESMLLGYRYRDLKTLVIEDVDDCTTDLINELRRRQLVADKEVDTLLLALLVIAIVDVAAVSLAMLANYLLVMRPLRNHVHRIEHNEPLDMIGAREIRTLAGAYNHIYEENHRRTMLLRHEAETDALTGLLNRGSYDRVLKHQGRDIALVLVDVDLFKQINDKWGHEVGDEVLRRVARALREHFRSTDYLCRIGGDEFAVILTEVGTEMRRMIAGKLDSIYESLDEAGDGVPAISLSSGIAFSVTLPEGIGLYHAADHALYEAKRRGRHQFAFYEGE